MSNIISSQVDIHKLYGGVVPEIASRNHAMAILGCAQTALNGAGVKMGDISRICATTEPGLRGAVMVGQIFGESLANATQKPFEKINHLCAHIASVFINTDTDFAPPFLALVASGGHTALYHVRAWDDINLVTQTVDDAVGEAFDKVAKILGLPYPGGRVIQDLAVGFEGEYITFVKNPRHKDFTYSGLKTAVLNYVQKAKRAGTLDVKQICASFQREAVGQLVTKSIEKMRELGIKKLCVCGGVSANTHLREQLALAVEKIGAVVHFPHMEFCTDNAAMVAAAAILGVKMHQSSQTC